MRNPVYLLLFTLISCASPHTQEMSDNSQRSELNSVYAVMADGYQLPVSTWETDEKPEAIILALHGFNDYRNAFNGPGHFFAAHHIRTYAYDQRGFGETAQRGIWPDNKQLETDAASMANLICARHPDLPLFLLGESMGAAVIMNMQHAAPCIKGVVLTGPAVWGWQTMPFWQRYALRFAAHTVPAKTLTGEGLNITPSDNVAMLHVLGRDPLVIKATRIDALYGLTNLMEAALLASSTLNTPTLILYGEKDEIIPHQPTCIMLKQLPASASIRFVLYAEGYHMLMRDLQANVVLLDTVTWIRNQAADLPSGQEATKTSAVVNRLCQAVNL